MAKKNKELVEQLLTSADSSQTFNPLLVALRENDKKNLFSTNVTTAFLKTGFHLFDYYFGSVINVHDELGDILEQQPRVGQAAGTFNMLIGSSGTGKGLPLHVKIPSPNGYILMGDIQVGDRVFGSNGKPVAVLGVFPQGMKDVYKITFSDGRYALCDNEHLWQVIKEDGVQAVIATDELINSNQKYSIPLLSAAVEYDTQNVPLDAYMFGLALGILTRNTTETLDTSIDFNSFNDSVVELLNKLVIPDIYLHNNYKIRVEIIKGLMRTCGDISNDPLYDLELHSSNEGLLKSFKYLINSLGCNAEIITTDNRSTLVRFNTPIRLLDKPNDILANYLSIKSIEFIGREETVCIKVDSTDELFLTEDFIVTHNTTMGIQLAANIIRPYPSGSVIHYDAEQRMDVSRIENVTQLPVSDFQDGGRYILKSGLIGMDVIQEMIVKVYAAKMQNKEALTVDTGYVDEFNQPLKIMQPTVIIIDSITSVINETFSPDNAKELNEMQQLQSNTEGARSAKTIKGFFKDILPLCKEANIIIYAVNHINMNMSMNSFIPVARQQNFLKQDESIPGGRTLLYYPFNIIKLTAKPGDDFTEESDGFAGHIVMVEPIKSSSNQSGNNSKGISFEMVFSFKNGFDSLRSIILYGRSKGIIEGNKNRMKFKGEDYTFSLKNIYNETQTLPIWEDIGKYIVPTLREHLPFVEQLKFDHRSMNY